MSVIACYMRIDPDFLDAASRNMDAVLSHHFSAGGCEIIDIDKAYEPLAWLASSLKRAENEHSNRLMFDDSWPEDEAHASVARLDAMPMDDLLVAIEGRADNWTDKINFGLGESALFSVERVAQLNDAIQLLNESVLRENLDFSEMDEHNVQPGYWGEVGEDGGEGTFRNYVLPGLKRLQDFYRKAAESQQIILIGYS